MSMVARDTLDRAVRQVGKLKEPDWKAFRLRGVEWDNVSQVIVRWLDDMKGHGVAKPLAALQEVAFRKSLKVDATQKKGSRPLHTVALWLTDTRIWIERFTETKSGEAKRVLEQRGLFKQKRGAV